jgi:ABC-type transporter Mla MlaB component
MLRITIQEESAAITLVLEGKCRGPWVDELKQSWRRARASASGRKLRVDLERVGFVDERGKVLLAEMHAAGVELTAVGLMMTSLVEEIATRVSPTSSQHA